MTTAVEYVHNNNKKLIYRRKKTSSAFRCTVTYARYTGRLIHVQQHVSYASSKIEPTQCRLSTSLQRIPASILNINLILPEIIESLSTFFPLILFAYLYLFSRSCLQKSRTYRPENVKWPFTVTQGHLFSGEWKASEGLYITV